jgi:hypothetical protein
MSALTHPTKITFAELREQGVRGVLIYCADYHCSHSVAISGDQWPDELRLSEIEAHGGRLFLISNGSETQSRPLTSAPSWRLSTCTGDSTTMAC